jgi:diguanylate cyclase
VVQTENARPSFTSAVRALLPEGLLPHSGALANARRAVEHERRHAEHRRQAALALAGMSDGGRRRSVAAGEVRSDQGAAVCGGIALSADELVRAADLAPAEGFIAAADAALELLQQRFTLDMWLVTRTRDGCSSVLAARGVAGMPVPAGAVLPWTETYCSRMVAGAGPRVAPRAVAVPAYASSPATERWGIAAYVGVPLLAPDGTLFGTLCGLSRSEQPETLRECLPEVEVLARLLGTVLAKEAAALERSQAASDAYALADRDQLTGLLSLRGWHTRLALEEERCSRHGNPASVVVVDLEGLADDALLSAVDVVTRASRPTDTVARTGSGTLSVLAVECDRRRTRALAQRLRDELRRSGLAGRVGWSARADAGDLPSAERQAADAAQRAAG